MNLMPLDVDGLRACSVPPLHSLQPRYWPTALAYRLRAPMLSATKLAARGEPCRTGIGIDDALFVIGYWRSGTTLLHELLASGPFRVTPTTHQCFNPQSFSLLRQGQRTATRPMDGIRISADSPQEDEFALAGLGAPSPYHLWVTPSRLATTWRHGLEFEDADAEDAWFTVFSDFAQRVADVGGKPLLLKSPPHAFRLELLGRRLPSSKFIYIARDPVEVYHSTVKMLTKMLEVYALEAWTPTDVAAYAIRTRRLLAQRIRAAAQSLSDTRFACIRFEDLLANPQEQIVNLLHRLGEPCPDNFVQRLSRAIQERQLYRRSYYSDGLALPDEVAAEWSEITEAWAAGELT